MKIIEPSFRILHIQDNALDVIESADNWREFKCIVQGCNRNVGVKKEGLCLQHYDQKRHTGKTTTLLITDPNEFIIYGKICKIVLRNICNENIAEAIIDIEDMEKVTRYKWGLLGRYPYSKKIGYLHRLVFEHPGLIDHINRNPLDNRKENLRKTTVSKNGANCTLRSNSTSGFKGVSKYTGSDWWRASITIKGKFISLGYYKNPTEAAKAYDKAAPKYFGEHAVTNKDMGLL